MSPKRLRISEGEKEERCYSDPLNSLPDELIRLILFKITDPKTLFVSSLVSKRIASILTHSQSLSLLPGEILRLIFSKITDPKTLLACFLVSKRFASILSHSQSLSLQFPTHLSFPRHFSQFPSAGGLFRRLRNLLLIFNRVQSLRIELPCPCCCPDDTVFRWKAKIGIRCVIVCFLAAKSVSKIDTKIDDKKRRSGRGGRRSRRTASADDTGWPYFYSLNAGVPYLYASAIHRLMQPLSWWHPNLDCVELVDSKKHGKLSIGREALIKLRTTMLDPTPKNTSNFITQRPGLEKIWYVPKLRLPVSGFEMKEVALMVSRDRNGGGCGGLWEEFEGSGDDDALDGGFEDDEHGIFGEAMTQLLARHPSKTFSL